MTRARARQLGDILLRAVLTDDRLIAVAIAAELDDDGCGPAPWTPELATAYRRHQQLQMGLAGREVEDAQA